MSAYIESIKQKMKEPETDPISLWQFADKIQRECESSRVKFTYRTVFDEAYKELLSRISHEDFLDPKYPPLPAESIWGICASLDPKHVIENASQAFFFRDGDGEGRDVFENIFSHALRIYIKDNPDDKKALDSVETCDDPPTSPHITKGWR